MVEETDIGNKLLGFYRGQVVQHLTHGYCKIYIPAVYPSEWKDNPQFLPPAEQAASLFAGTNTGSGVFTYPNIGSIVWVFFANNDQNYPVYFASSLGGENAFGQYEIIKSQAVSESERHLITSGKTHIEWYQNGKLSVQVEDPDRRDSLVDYTNNAYIGMISDDAVSARPICEKVQAEELSNIHCKLVFDNDNGTYGSISAQTHHYDLQKDVNVNMTLTNDNDFILDNAGHIKLEELSTHTFEDASSKTRRVNNNHFSMSVPGDSVWKNSLTQSEEKLGQLTSNMTSDNNVSYSTNGNYIVNVDNIKQTASTTSPYSEMSECTNSFRIEIPGKSELKNHLTSLVVTDQMPIDAITSDVNIQTTTDGSISHAVHVIANQETASDKNIKFTDTSLDKQQSIDSGYKHGMNYFHTDKNASIAITNAITSDMLANDNMNATKTFHMTSVGKVTQPVDVSFKDDFDAAAATIQRDVNNNITKITSIDDVDAINSQHVIKLEDKKSGNTSYVTMDTKAGVLTLSMEGSGHCTVTMTSAGIMTIDTTDKIIIHAPNEIQLTSDNTINIAAGSILNMTAPTINETGSTAVNINGTAGDCLISNVSLVKHTHARPHTDVGTCLTETLPPTADD